MKASEIISYILYATIPTIIIIGIIACILAAKGKDKKNYSAIVLNVVFAAALILGGIVICLIETGN